MKKFLNIFLKIIFSLLLLLSLILVFKRTFSKDSIPSIMNIGCLKVISGSMEPTYKVNDYILIKKTKNVSVGDAIVYKENNYYVTHRLIEINNNIYITQGDANNTTEEITQNNIVGKVIFYSSLASIFIGILSNPVILILIGIIVVLISSFGGKNESEDVKKTI